jgi:protease IV
MRLSAKMGRFLFRLCAVIGFLVILSGLGGLGVFLWFKLSAPGVASDTVLTLEISGALSDGPPQTGLAGLLAGPRRNLSDVLGALERARSDPRVKGLMLRIGGGELGLAQVQELSDAIRDFRAKGKPVFAYSDSYGEFESGTAAYYLASSCDEVWLQPLGLLSLVGPRAEQPFFRGSLDKLGIVPRFDKREEYKTAMNMLTDTAMTPAQREETTSLLTSLRGQIVSGIAQGRNLDPALVGDLIDKGPYLAQEALDNHLVDHLGYGEDALAGLKQAAGGDVKTMTLAHYLDRVGPPHAKGPVIALIYADGLMVRGKSDDTGLLGNGLMGSESVIHAFRLAERDKDVRAILFRIDSPGGSAVAAESVWNEVKAARAAGKKVIVSMGGVAGSGGYYIASDADKIVAEPATLTGSIGVLAGKVLVNGLSDKLGVTWDDVDTGGNAAMFSPIEDFSPAGHARFEAMLDDIYAGFKSRVAEGRQMDADWVENVAKGRVWTGEQAMQIKLVDALGGYEVALGLAKAQAGIAADQDFDLRIYPAPVGPVEALLNRLSGAGDDDTLARGLASFATLLRQAELLAAPPGALVMQPLQIR